MPFKVSAVIAVYDTRGFSSTNETQDRVDQVQYCQEITYQKPRPRRGHFASGVRVRASAGASVLRPSRVCVASTLRLRAPASESALRPRAIGRREIFIFRYRRKTSCFADFVDTNEYLLNISAL